MLVDQGIHSPGQFVTKCSTEIVTLHGLQASKNRWRRRS